MHTPAPPRNDAEFRLYYEYKRRKMIALVSAMGGGKINDPELVAEVGWYRFYPHWSDCRNPGGYLRSCIVSALRDEQRAMRNDLRITCVGTSEEDFAAVVPAHRLLSNRRPARQLVGLDPSDPELVAALASLSDEHRAVLVLAHELEQGERSYAELAEILGITRAAAAMRLNRAHARLRRILPDGYPKERHERLRAAWNLEERSAP